MARNGFRAPLCRVSIVIVVGWAVDVFLSLIRVFVPPPCRLNSLVWLVKRNT